MRSEFQVLVFDLDDTLYPEIDFAFSGFNAVGEWIRKEQNIDGFAKVAKQLFKNGKRGNVFDRALQDLGVNPNLNLIKSMVDVYRKHKPLIKPYPEVLDFIQTYKGGKKLGIISDGYLLVQRNKINTLGFDKNFDCIVLTDAWGREFWKPHPRSYNFIMDKFGVAGNKCVYIADNPEKDFITAKKLDWLTIRIKCPGGEHSEKLANLEHEADTSVLSLEDLKNIIAR